MIQHLTLAEGGWPQIENLLTAMDQAASNGIANPLVAVQACRKVKDGIEQLKEVLKDQIFLDPTPEDDGPEAA